MFRESKKINVFISYSPQDEVFKDEIEKHLKLLKYQGEIVIWSDRDILPGVELERAKEEALNESDIILLLISSDFIEQRWSEAEWAIGRHQANQVQAFSVLLRHVDIEGSKLETLQFLPSNGKWITEWQPRDKAFTEIAEHIRIAAQNIRKPKISVQAQITARIQRARRAIRKQIQQATIERRQRKSQRRQQRQQKAEAKRREQVMAAQSAERKYQQPREERQYSRRTVPYPTTFPQRQKWKMSWLRVWLIRLIVSVISVGCLISGVVGFQVASDRPIRYSSPEFCFKQWQACQALLLKKASAADFFDRASFQAKAGDLKSAIADLDQAIILKANFVLAYYNRGKIRFSLDDKQGAIADYSEAIKHDSKFAPSYKNRGTVRATLGDKQGAISDLDQAIQLNQNYSGAYYTRGRVRIELGDKQNAIADFDQAIKLNQNWEDSGLYEAYFYRGSVRFTQGDKQGAISDYTEAIRAKSDYAIAYNARGKAYSELEGTENRSTAIADFDKAIQFNSEFAEAYRNRGLAQFAMGNRASSIADFDKALSLEPNHPMNAEIYFKRGQLHLKGLNQSQAMSDFGNAIKLNPKNVLAHNELGKVQLAFAYDKQAALTSFDRVLELDPKRSSTYKNRGLAHFKVRNNKSAIADFDKAIALDQNWEEKSDRYEIYYYRGIVYIELAEELDQNATSASAEELLNKANLSFTEAINLKKNFAEAYTNRGLTQTDLKRALADHNQAIEYKPNFSFAFYNRGNTWIGLGKSNSLKIPRMNRESALSDFTQAIEINENWQNASLHEALAKRGAFRAEDDIEGAFKDLDRAIKLRSDYAFAYYVRSQVRRTQNPLIAGWNKSRILKDLEDAGKFALQQGNHKLYQTVIKDIAKIKD